MEALINRSKRKLLFVKEYNSLNIFNMSQIMARYVSSSFNFCYKNILQGNLAQGKLAKNGKLLGN